MLVQYALSIFSVAYSIFIIVSVGKMLKKAEFDDNVEDVGNYRATIILQFVILIALIVPYLNLGGR